MGFSRSFCYWVLRMLQWAFWLFVFLYTYVINFCIIIRLLVILHRQDKGEESVKKHCSLKAPYDLIKIQ